MSLFIKISVISTCLLYPTLSYLNTRRISKYFEDKFKFDGMFNNNYRSSDEVDKSEEIYNKSPEKNKDLENFCKEDTSTKSL